MAGKSLSVEGSEDVIAWLQSVKDTALGESALRTAAAKGATVLKEEAILRVPKKTGELASGITVAFDKELSNTGRIATYVVTVVGTYPLRKNGKPGMRKRDVAGWKEFGTSKMAAEPFMRPAFDAKGNEAANAVIETIREKINSVKSKP